MQNMKKVIEAIRKWRWLSTGTSVFTARSRGRLSLLTTLVRTEVSLSCGCSLVFYKCRHSLGSVSWNRGINFQAIQHKLLPPVQISICKYCWEMRDLWSSITLWPVGVKLRFIRCLLCAARCNARLLTGLSHLIPRLRDEEGHWGT